MAVEERYKWHTTVVLVLACMAAMVTLDSLLELNQIDYLIHGVKKTQWTVSKSPHSHSNATTTPDGSRNPWWVRPWRGSGTLTEYSGNDTAESVQQRITDTRPDSNKVAEEHSQPGNQTADSSDKPGGKPQDKGDEGDTKAKDKQDTSEQQKPDDAEEKQEDKPAEVKQQGGGAENGKEEKPDTDGSLDAKADAAKEQQEEKRDDKASKGDAADDKGSSERKDEEQDESKGPASSVKGSKDDDSSREDGAKGGGATSADAADVGAGSMAATTGDAGSWCANVSEVLQDQHIAEWNRGLFMKYAPSVQEGFKGDWEPYFASKGKVDGSEALAMKWQWVEEVTLTFRIKGSKWLLLMVQQSPNEEGGEDPEKDSQRDKEDGNAVEVTVDDCAPIRVPIRWDRTVYGVADTIPHSEHTVQLRLVPNAKRADVYGRFFGVLLEPAGDLLKLT